MTTTQLATTRKPAGIHIYFANKSVGRNVKFDPMITLVDNGGSYFCNLNIPFDRTKFQQIIKSGKYYFVGHNLEFTIIDIWRLLRIKLKPTFNMYTPKVPSPFSITDIYEGTANEKKISYQLARYYLELAIGTDGHVPLVITAPDEFLDNQGLMLYVLRVRWLEIQRLRLDVSDAFVEYMRDPKLLLDHSQDDKDLEMEMTTTISRLSTIPVGIGPEHKHLNLDPTIVLPPIPDMTLPPKKLKNLRVFIEELRTKPPPFKYNTYLKITMQTWRSHALRGTALFLQMNSGEVYLAQVRNIRRNIVKLRIDSDVPFDIQQIKRMWIDRSNEMLFAVGPLLKHMRDALCSEHPSGIAGEQWVAGRLHLRRWTQEELERHFENELTWCFYTKAYPGDAKDVLRYRDLKQRALRDLNLQAANINYILNSTQRNAFQLDERFQNIHGYPGTGKTHTMVFHVLLKFRQLLQRDSGYILCTCISNATARQIAKYIIVYPGLRLFFNFKFSPTFMAYHKEEYKEWYEYRVTRKHHWYSHGIILCVIGSLPALFHSKHHKHVLQRITDVFIDEGSQFWELDSMRLFPMISACQRVVLYGDTRQLGPFLAKMVDSKQGTIPPLNDKSLMAKYTDDIRSLSPRRSYLTVQYRMTPELMIPHAKTFYPDRKITCGSTTSHKRPLPRGLFLYPLPGYSSTPSAEWMKREANIAITVHKMITAKFQSPQPQPNLPTQQPPTIQILTPYLDQVDMLYERAPAIPASTIDRIQGSEYDIVILCTGRTQVADLMRHKNRVNVALSRARYFMVIIMQIDYAQWNPQGQLGFWGQYIVASTFHINKWSQLCPDVTLASLLDRRSMRVVSGIERKIAIINGDIKPHASATGHKSSYTRGLAAILLAATYAYDSLCDGRIEYAREHVSCLLFLKQEYKLNRPAQMRVFRGVNTCTLEIYRSILLLYVTEDNHRKRMTGFLQLLQLPPWHRHQAASNELETYVRQYY